MTSIPLPWRSGWLKRSCYCLLFLCGLAVHLAAQQRLRIIIETDAGGDPDDEQGLVRFLVYANEWDIDGIIANRPHARDGENLNPERTGLGIVRRDLQAYGKVYPFLSKNAPGYPTEKYLWDHTVPGYSDTEAGVNLVIAAVDRDDPRPVWFLNWGTDHGSAPSCLLRALDKILAERGPVGYAKFKSKIRLSSDDKFGDHTYKIRPPFQFLVVPSIPRRAEDGSWHPYVSELLSKAGGFDLKRDVLTGHGPLGALYPTNTDSPQKEGDSVLFLYLMPTGMNDPLHPEWGSWAGRFGPRRDFPEYYESNVADTWHGTTTRANTLARWAVDIQNDFRAHMDWCVKPYQDANHEPRAVLNGDTTKNILMLPTQAGATVTLSAEGSSDPDGNALTYDWFVYPEAGTYRGNVVLEDAAAKKIVVKVPADAAGKTIHVIVRVCDNGKPPLVSYRRAILEVQATAP